MWPSINVSSNGNGTCTSSEKSKSTETPAVHHADADQNSSDSLAFHPPQWPKPDPPSCQSSQSSLVTNPAQPQVPSLPLPSPTAQGIKKESSNPAKPVPPSRQNSHKSTESTSSELEHPPKKKVKLETGTVVNRGRRRNAKKVVKQARGMTKNGIFRKWSHKCDYCDYTDYARSRILLHMVKHTGKPPYKCDHCEYACYRKFELTDHMAEQHPAEYAKSIAEKTEKKRNASAPNVESAKSTPQSEELPYVLPKAPLPDPPSTSHESDIRSPGSLRKGDNLYCVDCDYVTDKKWNMDRHVQALHPASVARQHVYVCFVTKCRYRTIYQANFNAHITIKHPEVDPDNANSKLIKKPHKKRFLSAAEREPQTCSICSYTTHNDTLFKLHLQRKHGVSENSNHSKSTAPIAGTDQNIGPTVSSPTDQMAAELVQSTPEIENSPAIVQKKVIHKCTKVECEFTAHTKLILRKHMKKCHTEDTLATSSQQSSPMIDEAMLKPKEGVTDGRKYACPYCEFRTRKKFNLQVHLQKGHSGPPKPYKCPQCPYTCNLPGGVRTHCMKIHKIGCPPVSPSPGVGGNNGEQRRKSWPASHTPKNKAASFSLKVQAKTTERPMEELRCELCPYTTIRKMWMTIHMKKHARNPTVANALVSPSTGSGELSDAQNPSTTPFSTPAAPLTTAAHTPAVSMVHSSGKQGRHPGLHKRGLRKSTMSRQQYYGCDECGFRCKGKYALDVHKRSHSMLDESEGSQAEFSVQEMGVSAEKQKFFCHLCRFWCLSQAWLTIHLKRQHQQQKKSTAVKVMPPAARGSLYSCDQCEYSTHVPAILKRHMLKHTGERPFSCHLCDRKFAQKYNLTAHVKLHAA